MFFILSGICIVLEARFTECRCLLLVFSKCQKFYCYNTHPPPPPTAPPLCPRPLLLWTNRYSFPLNFTSSKLVKFAYFCRDTFSLGLLCFQPTYFVPFRNTATYYVNEIQHRTRVMYVVWTASAAFITKYKCHCKPNHVRIENLRGISIRFISSIGRHGLYYFYTREHS